MSYPVPPPSDSWSMRRYRFALPAVLAALVAMMVIAWQAEANRFDRTRHTLLHDRAQMLKANMEIAANNVATMQQAISWALELADAGHMSNPAAENLRAVGGDRNLYVSLPGETPAISPLVGSIVGIGTPETVDIQTAAEISAAAVLDPITAALRKTMPEVAWIYFMSPRGVVYFAPRIPAEESSISYEMMNSEWWQQAIPERNPDREVRITSAYEDNAGKGPVVTVSAPVYTSDQFRGVVGIDHVLQTLSKILQADSLTTDSLQLVDENATSILATGSLGGEYRDTPLYGTSATRAVLQDRTVTSIPVIAGQLWLFDELTDTTRTKAIAEEAMKWWIISALSALTLLGMLRLHRAFQTIRYLVGHDPLTGLLNRRAFMDKTAPLLELCQRQNRPFSVLMLDVDHFKQINDNFGHATGDRVLTYVSAVTFETMRKSDIICRHGGEEFLIALPDTDIATARAAAERLRRAIEQGTSAGTEKRKHSGIPSVTVSIGCAERLNSEPLESTIDRSDAALYEAKHGGRNRVTSWESVSPELD